MNYIKLFEDGTSEAVDVKPSWGMYEKEHALDNREVYIDGNWYSTTGGELVTNGDFSTSIGAEWVGNISIVSSMGKIVESGNMARLTVSDLTPNEINVIIINIVNIVSGTPRMYIRDNKINEIYITNLTVGNHLIEIVPKFTTVDLSFYFNGGGTGEYYIDNISVYKKEPTIDTLQPPHTYLSNKGKLAGIEVANGIPVDIHYDELAPTLVEDTIKATDIIADEYHGKNACTAWVNFDGTTTPPTIRDSFNVSDVVRTAAGQYNVFFTEDMDNILFSVGGSCTAPLSEVFAEGSIARTVSSVNVVCLQPGVATRDVNKVSVQILGGKN